MSAGDGDFAFETQDRATQQFGFDDRFEEAGLSAFRANGFDSDEASRGMEALSELWMELGATELTWTQTLQDAEWAPFEGMTARDATGGSPEETAAEFSAFESSFDPSSEDADDFGDFEAAEPSASPSIVLPSMDQFEDFDLGEESRPAATSGSGFGGAVDLSASSSASSSAAGGAVAPVADDVDGSDRFGRLSLGDSSSSSSVPTSPQTSRSTTAPAPPSPVLAAAESASSASSEALAREEGEEDEEDEEEDLGPALHPGAHLTEDGQVEAEVEGRTIRVPADDIIMTSRRNSLEGGNRHHSHSTHSRSRSNSISISNEKTL